MQSKYISNNVRSLYGLQPLTSSNTIHAAPKKSSIHPKTIQSNIFTIKGTDDIVHVNTTLTNSRKEVTMNDVGTFECLFRLAILFSTNRTQFEQFFY